MRIDTLVIGGGQAGLAVSYHLSEHNQDHLILERSRVGESWRSRVWDSFCLVTPSWTVQLPGFCYDGPDPDGYMSRDELVAYLVRYAAKIQPPLRTGVEVVSIRQNRLGNGFAVATSDGAFAARNVVVAVGGLHAPQIPFFSANISARVTQIHSSEYRNGGDLPLGAVLVVGAGQSGAQIAEELYQSGRQVYLSVGRCSRGPRRYRGRDLVWWLDRMGSFDQPVVSLAPDARPAHNLQMSGKNGGHDLNLRRFASEGVRLIGRLVDGSDERLRIAPDLCENLRYADTTDERIKHGIDEFIKRSGLAAPDEAMQDGAAEARLAEELKRAEDAEPILELDLRAAKLSTIIWATGYRPDFSWIRLPLTRADGCPDHTRGVTRFPGLYFVGLRFLHTLKSELLLGVGEDAAFVAAQIASAGLSSP